MKTNNSITPGKIRVIEEYGFGAPVYRPARYEIGERWSDDWTGENRAAHGNIVQIEEENGEGRQRYVAVNGVHREVGPWGPAKAVREDKARRDRAKAVKELRDAEDEAARVYGVAVFAVEGDTVWVDTHGERKVISMRAIREAAADPSHPRMDAATALAMESEPQRRVRLAYRALLRQAEEQQQTKGEDTR